MKPAPFTYHAPESTAEAVSLLGRLGDGARVLAGGQSLVPLMNFRLAQPSDLVDLRRVRELDYIQRDGDRLAIGALARQSALERSPEAAAAAPLLVEAVGYVAHPPIRHRGTVCGCVAHAEPAAELPAALLAEGAEVVATGPSGDRTIPIQEFLRGPFTTSLEPGELVKEVRVASWPSGTGHAFVEYSRRHGDFAVAGAAVLVQLESGGVARAAIALCGVAETAIRRQAAEAALTGTDGGPAALDAAAEEATRDLAPSADIHGSADYRRRVARVCVREALSQAIDRARGGAQ